jgi:hypothetical protein
MRSFAAALAAVSAAAALACARSGPPLGPGSIPAELLRSAEARLERSVDRCESCHPEPMKAEVTHFGRPLGACDVCHVVREEHREGDADAALYVRTERLAHRSCGRCHEPMVAAGQRSVHPALETTDAAECLDCHLPHSARASRTR